MKITKRRNLVRIVVGISVAALVIGGLVWFIMNKVTNRADMPTVDNNAKEINQPDRTTPTETRIKIAAMGDMLAHDSVNLNAKTDGGYDYKPYFQYIKPIYADADIVFCNQEGLSAGTKFGISGYPSFNAPTEFADGLSAGAGCNVINLANNHIGDKGQSAINVTLDKWDTLKTYAVAGANRSAAEQQAVKFFEVKGVKFAFLAFADYSNNRSVSSYGLNNYHNETLFDAQVAEARAQADMVIVSMHWGTEDSSVVNADQQRQIAKLSQANIDIVIGTGPHVLQKTEWVNRPDGKKLLVWYSIGNMLSTQLKLDELTGCLAKFEIVKKDDAVSIEKPTCTPTLMSYYWTAAEKQASDILKRRDLQLKPLKDSAENITKMYFNETVESRADYVRRTFGDTVEITL
jgi:poly-gamma-glutamate synthesis protein (capsule biosynthesis protein)